MSYVETQVYAWHTSSEKSLGVTSTPIIPQDMVPL